jgi:hypothetical protein
MTESMSPGELRGLATFLVSIRDDWQPVPVRAALEKLQGYSLVDVAEVCTEIARNRSNQYPKMLELKGAEMIRAKHGRKSKARSNQKLPDQYTCDECGKVRSACMTAARSADGTAGHTFISAAERNADRDRMHADGRITEAVAAARAVALDKATRGGMFAMPADIDQPTHPEPEQESA